MTYVAQDIKNFIIFYYPLIFVETRAARCFPPRKYASEGASRLQSARLQRRLLLASFVRLTTSLEFLALALFAAKSIAPRRGAMNFIVDER